MLRRTLITVNASGNELTEVLDFRTRWCKDAGEDAAWAEGDMWIGSTVEWADLSRNRIGRIRDLSAHRFLRYLDLSRNRLAKIEGLDTLDSLRTLKLAYNSLTSVEGLNGLLVDELHVQVSGYSLGTVTLTPH